jgi:glycogen operon protein
MEKEPSLLDEQSVGLPDVSYHGRKAWCPEFDDSVRQLGIFYCGQYAKKADGKDDDYFYVAYNMHWEPHEFALPNLPRGLKWHLAFDTFEESVNGFYLPGSEPCVTEQKTIQLEARSIKVLIGKKTDDGKKSRRNQAQC